MRNKIQSLSYVFLALLIFFNVSILFAENSVKEPPILNVYHWFQMIPEDVLKIFEQETGIRVNLDVYDSNDVLEARLLAGKTGYDVVGPSAFPYLARQVPAGLYKPLDKDKLPNMKGLDPTILEKLATSDPDNKYALPLLWGLVGLGVNREKLEERLGKDTPLDSWSLLLDKDKMTKISSCGVTLLEEAADIFLPIYLYLGLPHDSNKREDLEKVTATLMDVRPYISRLDSVRSADDLMLGNVCMAMHWIGDLYLAKQALSEQKNMDHIEIFIPKEGSVMWIDSVAIPVDAPHPDNAHRFLNFLIRPDIMARLTNKTYFANPVSESLSFVKPDIRQNKNIFPDAENMKRIFINVPAPASFARQVNRAMMKVRTGR